VRSRNHCCRSKAISIIYFRVRVRARGCLRVCVGRCQGACACALTRARVYPNLSSMQRACAIFCCHLWLLSPPYFRYLLINGTIFGKRSNDRLTRESCTTRQRGWVTLLFVLWAQGRLRGTRDRVGGEGKWQRKTVSWVKLPRRIFQKYQISWKSVPWEQSCSMRLDVRTDGHDDASSRFAQFRESA
jgi:hypothetical protein